MRTLPRRRARVFARQRVQQLALAVARHTGDAHHLAGAHAAARCRPGRRRTGRLAARVRPLTSSTAAPGVQLATLQRRRLGADHQARERGVAFLARVAHAGDLAAAQHGAGGAQLADLVQLVADVEDAAAFRRPACFSTTNSFSTACGVSTEVGSSRISSCGSVSSARMISTRCISPTLERVHRARRGRCPARTRWPWR